MIFLLSKYTILKVCEADEQALYWADLLAPTSDYFIADVNFKSFEYFSIAELCKILDNHNVAYNVDKWDRETFVGSVVNVIKAMDVDTTEVWKLEAKLKRKPEPLQIVQLTHAQREKQMGAPNTSRTLQMPTGGSSIAKRPKAGTTTAKVWEKCDELLESGVKVEDNDFRDAILVWAENEGVNKSTARTQFGHWKRDNLLK